MSITKAEAIVIHSRKQGETSKILTVLTSQFGKMTLIAKGARNPKSKYLGVLDTFNQIAIVLYRKENRDIQFLSQAEIINSFPSLHASLGKMALAAITCELIEKSEPQEHANPELYKYLLEALETLELSENGLRNIVRSFQLKFIENSGFHPNLEHCNKCKKTEPSSINFFDVERGFYNCENCGIRSQVNIRLQKNALENLRWLNQAPISESTKAQVSALIGKQIDDFLLQYIKYHFEHLHYLKSLKYLKELSNGLHKN
jgi:DNA repair protein RecO (recombination protein O)